MHTRLGRLSVLFFTVLGLILPPASARAAAPPQVLLGGAPLALPPDQPLVMMPGAILVPMRAIFTALGAEVSWEGQSQTVTARKGVKTVVLAIGGCAGRINGVDVPLAYDAQLIGGRTYVPLRFVSEALGAKVGWDEERRIATIDWPASPATVQTTFAAAPLEAAVRTLVGNPDRPLTAAELARVTDLTVSAAGIADLKGIEGLVNLRRLHLPGNQIRDIRPLRNLNQLSDLDLRGNPITDRSPLASLTGLTALALDDLRPEDEPLLTGMTGLTRLGLVRRGAGQQGQLPPACSDMETTAALPLRVETAHGVFLGDRGITIANLLAYGEEFEERTVPGLARETGLRPERRKTLLQIYGDPPTWYAVPPNPGAAGYYASQRVYMAQWLTPGSVNSLLLAHEYLHWLVGEVGNAHPPAWFNEGLAFNESQRTGLEDAGYARFIAAQWQGVEQATGAAAAVPMLQDYDREDAYVITAVWALLQYHGGREALTRFLSLTRAGKTYAEAFASAFGISPGDYQAEYEQLVAYRRNR